MGYNSNLPAKSNRVLNKNNTASKNAHPVWITGMILKIVGAVIIILTGMFIVGSGGWGLLGYASPLGLVPLAGILCLAFGQYFTSNWKNR